MKQYCITKRTISKKVDNLENYITLWIFNNCDNFLPLSFSLSNSLVQQIFSFVYKTIRIFFSIFTSKYDVENFKAVIITSIIQTTIDFRFSSKMFLKRERKRVWNPKLYNAWYINIPISIFRKEGNVSDYYDRLNIAVRYWHLVDARITSIVFFKRRNIAIKNVLRLIYSFLTVRSIKYHNHLNIFDKDINFRSKFSKYLLNI